MIIKRKQFLEELQLREQVRRIIKIVKKRKQIQEGSDEQRFRAVIRGLISEQEEAPGEVGRATGIKVLDEEVLQNIVPIFKKYYFQLDNPEKRESFRSHIINAAENLLNTADSGPGPVSATLSEPAVDSGAPIAEQDVSMAVGGGPRDDPMYIPMSAEAPADPEADEQQEFRTGLDDELTPAYKDLRGDDAVLFREYLITNLKLHFDTMEEELNMTPEPTTPSYEEEAAEAEPEMPLDAPQDIEMPAEAPPGAPLV